MLSYEILSESGNRKENEDYVGIVRLNDEKYCFILADGLGGHCGGAEASKLVVENVKKVFKKEKTVSEECMHLCFQKSQEILIKEQIKSQQKYGMKTTLVILMIDYKQVIWGHIGDSRLYFFEKNQIIERTMDHSVPQILVNSGKLSEKKIRGHKERNRLLHVMGVVWEEPGYQIASRKKIKNNTSFLLCSDGFWELIKERKMEYIRKRAINPEDWIQRMERYILKKGKKQNMDNYSAIGIWIRGE